MKLWKLIRIKYKCRSSRCCRSWKIQYAIGITQIELKSSHCPPSVHILFNNLCWNKGDFAFNKKRFISIFSSQNNVFCESPIPQYFVRNPLSWGHVIVICSDTPKAQRGKQYLLIGAHETTKHNLFHSHNMFFCNK